MTVPPQVRAVWERARTWYNAHSERDRRVILGVLVAILLSLVYVGVVDPILDYRKGLAAQIADGQEELERSMRFLAAKDALRAERDDLRKRLAAAKTRLLPGGTGTLGAAALQERTNALASEKGITVQSTQVMKEETVEPFRKVAVRLTLSGELKPLADFVSGLEYDQQLGVPFIEVSRRGAVAGAKGPRTLSVTVEVNGFVQGGAAGKTEGEGEPPVETAAEGSPGETTTTTTAGEGGAVPPTSTTVVGASTTTIVPAGDAVPPPAAVTTTNATVTTHVAPSSLPAAAARVPTTRPVPTTLSGVVTPPVPTTLLGAPPMVVPSTVPAIPITLPEMALPAPADAEPDADEDQPE